jgi:hypothetical protein
VSWQTSSRCYDRITLLNQRNIWPKLGQLLSYLINPKDRDLVTVLFLVYSMMAQKAQQPRSHAINRCFPSHRLQVPNRNYQVMSMLEFVFASFTGFKRAHNLPNLSF